MLKYSQNKKIAISSIALFAISFSTMIFFLGGDIEGAANVMGAGSHGGGSAGEHGGSEAVVNEINKSGFSTDVSGNITAVGKDFCALLNQKCPDLIKQPIYKYVDKEDFSEMSEVLGKLVESSHSIDSIGPIRVSADQKKEKLIILSAKSVKNPEGKITGINFTVKDITDKVDGTENKTDAKKTKSETEEGIKSEWMDSIYPKIEDVNKQGNKLLVKLSFNY